MNDPVVELEELMNLVGEGKREIEIQHVAASSTSPPTRRIVSCDHQLDESERRATRGKN